MPQAHRWLIFGFNQEAAKIMGYFRLSRRDHTLAAGTSAVGAL
jgi:hypothetical protein